MKYTIRPTGTMGLVERGVARVYRDDENGKQEQVSDYNNALLPMGSRSHRVLYDTKRRKYDINISKDSLSRIAKEMRLVDPITKKLIETADLHNEFDPFFSHDLLTLEVPNGGITMDTETAEGEFWFEAIKSEPKKFNIDNKNDNPLEKKMHEFKVTTAGHSEKEVKKDIDEGKRATGIYHANKDNVKWCVTVCRGLDIVVEDQPDDLGVLQDAIYSKITLEKDFKTQDGVRNIEKFLILTDMKKSDFEIRGAIGKAIGLKIIERNGRKYEFEDEQLGPTPDKVFDYLTRKENEETLGKILARLKKQGA